jgi:hypothetical protein
MVKINWLDFIFFLFLDCFWKDLRQGSLCPTKKKETNRTVPV